MDEKKYKWMRKKIRDVIVGCECKGKCTCEVSVEKRKLVKRVLGIVDWYVKNV